MMYSMADRPGPDRFPGVVPVDPALAEGVQPLPEQREPWSVAYDFLKLLKDPLTNREQLLSLTTPESHRAWGDFTAAAAAYASISNRAMLETCGSSSGAGRASGRTFPVIE
jgi:hypothetical protein